MSLNSRLESNKEEEKGTLITPFNLNHEQMGRRGSWDSPIMWGEERTDGEPDVETAIEWFRLRASLRAVHLGRSTCHAISSRGVSQLGFRTVE